MVIATPVKPASAMWALSSFYRSSKRIPFKAPVQSLPA